MRRSSKLVDQSKKVIYTCSTVFPFTLFRDHVVVDENKVDLVYSYFFFSSSVFTVLLEDIKSVKVDVGPFFAMLQFEVVGYEKNPAPINFIERNTGIMARRIIMGLSMLKRKEVDMSHLSEDEIREKAAEIGLAHD